MTDEQWLWLFANESLDADEKFEQLCPTCQHDVTSHRCIRCGKPLGGKSFKGDSVNPNFDAERFDRLSSGTESGHSEDKDDSDVDYDLLDDILRRQGGDKE